MDRYIKTKQYNNYKIDFYELNCITENFVVAKYSKYSNNSNSIFEDITIMLEYINDKSNIKKRITTNGNIPGQILKKIGIELNKLENNLNCTNYEIMI